MTLNDRNIFNENIDYFSSQTFYTISCDNTYAEIYSYNNLKIAVDKLYSLEINEERKYCMLAMIMTNPIDQVIIIDERCQK